MSKYAVLKDLSGRIAGYVRADETAVFCRIQLGFPAKLAAVFSDGTQADYALSESAGEQCISCDGKNMLGCYVFKEDELLLVSDETMRGVFVRRALSCRNSEAENRIQGRVSENKEHETVESAAEAKENHENEFPQRRWPKPPCWDEAIYRQGRWQEIEGQDQREPGC